MFDSLTPKHRYSRWNFVVILCTSWDISIRSLEAAILNFPLPVSSRLTVEHGQLLCLIVGPRKHRYSRWNFVAILCASWDIRSRSLVAANLNFSLSVSQASLKKEELCDEQPDVAEMENCSIKQESSRRNAKPGWKTFKKNRMIYSFKSSR